MKSPRRYFDEIQIGEEYESPGRTVTEADIVLFAGLSGDYNILHTDVEFMKTSIFGERIAHGLLVLSMQSGLLPRGMEKPYATIAFGGLRWKFKAPVKIGDTIQVRARVVGKKETRPDRGVITLERTIVNQRGEIVQQGETDVIVERAPAR
jgi:acyl dehydratase